MNDETLRAVLVFAGGALGFLGAVLTFLNGRLQQTRNSDERTLLFRSYRVWCAVFLDVAACVLWISFDTTALVLILFTLAFTINAWNFVASNLPLGRKELLTFILICCSYTALVVTIGGFALLNRILHVLETIMR